jgi:hypothetical protein
VEVEGTTSCSLEETHKVRRAHIYHAARLFHCNLLGKVTIDVVEKRAQTLGELLMMVKSGTKAAPVSEVIHQQQKQQPKVGPYRQSSSGRVGR